MRGRSRWLLQRATLAAVGLVVLKSLVSLIEPRMVFFPYKGEDANPAQLGLRYDVVPLTTSDGERLVAWQFEPDDPRADVLYFHGNGGNLSVWMPVMATLHRLGYRVLAIDYRGYGLSSGTPTEEGLYRDAEAAVQHVMRERRRDRPVVFWGRSLGGAVAAAATRVAKPDGVILESTFPDKASVLRSHFVLRGLNVFSSYRFPTLEFMRGVDRPVLVMHADRDSIIPYALGRELFERLDSPKQFATVAGADHNDFFGESAAAYWTPVTRFIESLEVR